MAPPTQTPSAVCRICGGSTRTLAPFQVEVVVRRCRDCHTEVLSPLPTPEELQAYYTGYGTTQTPEEELGPLLDVAETSLDFYLRVGNRATARGMSFLDIGFGNGAAIFAAARRGMEVTGIDPDTVSVTAARARAERFGLHPSLAHGTVDTVLSTGRTFELVKASQVLEHVLDPVEFIAKAARLQRRDGLLVIDCPNNGALFWRIKNALRGPFNRPNFYNALKLGEHLWGFNRRSLRHLFTRAGYEVLHCQDYSVADAYAQPDFSRWYIGPRAGLALALRERRAQPLLNAAVRTFDLGASRLLGAGMGLVGIGRKIGD